MPPLRRFAVRLAVIIHPEKVARSCVADLQEELDMRPHLENPRVRWDAVAQQITVELIDLDCDAERSGDGMKEEVLEATAAVMGDFDAMRIEVIDVQPIVDDGDPIASSV